MIEVDKQIFETALILGYYYFVVLLVNQLTEYPKSILYFFNFLIHLFVIQQFKIKENLLRINY